MFTAHTTQFVLLVWLEYNTAMPRTEDKTEGPDWSEISRKYVETGVLPEAYTQAQEYYDQVLSRDSEWVKQNRGLFVAISGTEILGTNKDVDKLVDEIEGVHGERPFFVPHVGEAPKFVRISPRIKFR